MDAGMGAGARQRGAALVASLVFLLLLSLISSAGIQMSTLQERMAANSRQRHDGFQAAEAGLRRVEDLLRSEVLNNRPLPAPCQAETCELAPQVLDLDAQGLAGIGWRQLEHDQSVNGVQLWYQVYSLGESLVPVKAPGEAPAHLYRVVVVGLSGNTRIVLESMYVLGGGI
ncbi:pilus assembly protein PilX [Pseudomonas sp. WN033]|nr:pilus assembly protein PilX [Pseudomonas sp. WN033]